MTCCIGQVCTDGILLASDSLVLSGNTKITLPEIKGFSWNRLDILYAGDVAYIQRLQAKPNAGYNGNRVLGWQQLLWDFPPSAEDEAEFLVVDADWKMFIVDRWGASVQVGDYGVVGSELGWVAMHMTEQRERTMAQAKRVAAKALRAVAHQDSSVAEPFRYKELAW